MKKQLAALLMVLMFVITACKHFQILPDTQTVMPDNPVIQTESAVIVTVTPDSTSFSITSCVWNWASQDLPDITAVFTEALAANGLTDVVARASAYGENCFDPSTNQVVSFATMETDWYITINLQSLEDKMEIGNKIRIVIEVIRSLKDTAPGPNPGYVGISLVAGESTENLWFTVSEGIELIDQDLSGQGLYDALQ